MSAQKIGGGDWPLYREIIQLFIEMGCQTLTLSENLFDAEGAGIPIRFLYNPASKVFVALDEFDDEMRMTPSEIDHFERRLDIEIPKKDSWRID